MLEDGLDLFGHAEERRIAHAEASADVLGNQSDCAAIADGVGLGQIFHGVDQETLAIHVTRIRDAFTRLSS